jgi:hypothetical protein
LVVDWRLAFRKRRRQVVSRRWCDSWRRMNRGLLGGHGTAQGSAAVLDKMLTVAERAHGGRVQDDMELHSKPSMILSTCRAFLARMTIPVLGFWRRGCRSSHACRVHGGYYLRGLLSEGVARHSSPQSWGRAPKLGYNAAGWSSCGR